MQDSIFRRNGSGASEKRQKPLWHCPAVTAEIAKFVPLKRCSGSTCWIRTRRRCRKIKKHRRSFEKRLKAQSGLGVFYVVAPQSIHQTELVAQVLWILSHLPTPKIDRGIAQQPNHMKNLLQSSHPVTHSKGAR
jgi:hypothetical protein